MNFRTAILIIFSILAVRSLAEMHLASEGKRVLILLHSRTGNTLAAAQEIKLGFNHDDFSQIDIKRVPSISFLEPTSGAVASLPIASLDDLALYDNIIFGSPVYFSAPSAEILAFLQNGMEIWRNQTLRGKRVAVFFSSNGNGVSSASDALRATLRALHMESETLNNACGTSAADWEGFGRCLSERILHPSSTIPSIELPTVPTPVGNYLPYRIANNKIYINQISLQNGLVLYPGEIGTQITDDEAKVATRQAMLNVLAVLNEAVRGDLSRVKQVVEISGFFYAKPGYTMHSMLLNEASSLAVQFLGVERGQHARAAFGVSSLPLNSPVELKAIFELMP